MSEIHVDTYRACVQSTQQRVTHRVENLCQIPYVNNTSRFIDFNNLVADGMYVKAIFFAIIAFTYA